MRKLNRQQKAANIREAKQALKETIEVASIPNKTWRLLQNGLPLKVSENEMPFTPKVPLALCGQLEDAILLLETRISNAIAKINSLM